MDGFVDISAALRSGVYLLKYRGAVVYVGKAKVMLTRVYSHRRAWADKRQKARDLPEWFPIKGILFDEVQILPVPIERLDEVERALIARLQPKHNVAGRAKESLAGKTIGGLEFPPERRRV